MCTCGNVNCFFLNLCITSQSIPHYTQPCFSSFSCGVTLDTSCLVACVPCLNDTNLCCNHARTPHNPHMSHATCRIILNVLSSLVELVTWRLSKISSRLETAINKAKQYTHTVTRRSLKLGAILSLVFCDNMFLYKKCFYQKKITRINKCVCVCVLCVCVLCVVCNFAGVTFYCPHGR